MKKMMEMLEEKGEASPADLESPEVKSKLDILQDLKAMMEDILKGDVEKGLKKVTVAAKDEESLKEGLDKAKEVVEEMPKMEEEVDEESEEEPVEELKESDKVPEKKEVVEEKMPEDKKEYLKKLFGR